MIAPILIACCCAATTCLALGIVVYRKRITAARGLDKLLYFSPVFMAMSLATFAMEHFLAASTLASIVPSWLPFHLFFTYLVGVALLAAAVSFSINRFIRWSALLLTVLFVSFVFLIHVPNTIHHWHERLFWTLIARELLFAAGALVLAVRYWQGGFLHKTCANPAEVGSDGRCCRPPILRSSAFPLSRLRSGRAPPQTHTTLGPPRPSVGLWRRSYLSCIGVYVSSCLREFAWLPRSRAALYSS